jgi:hypothetical protein
MSAFDSLAEHHRQRALRALPRHDGISGPHNAEPPPSWGDRAVVFVAFAIFMWFVLA